MGYGYGYGGGGLGNAFDDVFGVMSGALLGLGVFVFLMFAVWVGLYILQAIGLQRMAQHRGEKNSWFAWIPFLSYILIGNMVGRFSLGKYDIKNPGLFTAILGLSIANVSLFGTGIISIFAFIPVLNLIVGIVLGIAISLYPLAVLVFIYMLLYKLYKQYEPEKATMWLVLTILFSSIVMPIFFFTHRDKAPAFLPEVNQERLQ